MTDNLKKAKVAYRVYRQLLTEMKREEEAVREARQKLSTAKKTQRILQSVAKSIQQRMHLQIAGIVTRCISIFDNPYEFKIIFDKKRGKTEAKFVFERDGLQLSASDGIGGGVLDVAAFALRLACLLIQKPKKRRILIMDEPFRFVSEKNSYREKVVGLIETLAAELRIQFVFVTHDPLMEMGRVIHID